MVEFLFIYQLARKPVQAIARRLVVPQPLPRLAGPAALSGMHPIVIARLFAAAAMEPIGSRGSWFWHIRAGVTAMTSKPDSKNNPKDSAVTHAGMMGDGTEEQSLGERGNPAARIKKHEVEEAFAKGTKKP
jgi:hypothetical protein